MPLNSRIISIKCDFKSKLTPCLIIAFPVSNSYPFNLLEIITREGKQDLGKFLEFFNKKSLMSFFFSLSNFSNSTM